MPRVRVDDITNRFWSKVDKSRECWIWTAGKDKNGYGKFSIKHISYRAHRVSYAYFVALKPEALFVRALVCHTCDNPACVRPQHLFLGTNQDNMSDKVAKGRHRTLKGSDVSNSKLTENEVRTIRMLWENGESNQKRLAECYEVSRATICNIVNYKGWKDA